MACPEGTRFTGEMFRTAMEDFDLWEAIFCAYGTPLTELAVGTIVYAAFAMNIWIRTNSTIIPFVLTMIYGGTVLGQMFGVINAFATVIILIVAPAIITLFVLLLSSRFR